MAIHINGHTGWSSIPNAIGRSRLPHPTVHLLINLLGHSDGFNASYSTLRKQTGMSPGTISTALEHLKKLGLISVKKAKPKGSQYASNDYDFHPERIWTLTPELVDERIRGKSPATGNEVESPGSPATGVVPASATGVVSAPLREMDTKNDKGEQPRENDQPPLAPQGEVVVQSKEVAKAAPKNLAAKGSRLAAGWMPSQPTIDRMAGQFPDMNFDAVHEEFTDYWLGVPGQKGVKVDWDATWRNWIRRAGNEGRYPRVQSQAPSTARQRPSKADQKAGWYMSKAEQLAAEYAAEEGNHEA